MPLSIAHASSAIRESYNNVSARCNLTMLMSNHPAIIGYVSSLKEKAKKIKAKGNKAYLNDSAAF